MKVNLVDKNDIIIGSKERNNLDYAVDIYQSASLWITNSKGEILLAQRKMDKAVDPGKWAEAVGGTVDEGDDYRETIIREAEEELGLKNIEFMVGPKQFIQGDATYFVQWFYSTIDKPAEEFIVQESEVESIAWISKEDLEYELQNIPNKYIDALPEIIQALYIS